MPMETVLICLLLLYNAWLVSYILSGRQRKSPPQVEDKPPSKPPHRGDDIVGKSRFKMQTKVPQDSRPEPQAAKADEGEEVTDIAVTFADDKDETPTSVSKTFRGNMRTMKEGNGHRLNGMPPERALRKSGKR